jgi:glycosyltransferase involved in cell wall biosynthesis
LIFYLTYNDLPSGIFSSQVIDVVKFFNLELKTNVKLISFISLRSFLKNRKNIKNQLPEAIVLPMFPGVQRWRLNTFALNILTLIYKPTTIIGRSVLASQLALIQKHKNKIKKVIYDGRGAITAEWKEYQVVSNSQLVNEIFELEKETVLKSDYKIAVSEQLVNYWKREFKYEGTNHVIIPCTLNKIYEDVLISRESIEQTRKFIGLNKNDIAFIYSGSIAGWQSFNLLNDFIKPLLIKRTHIKLIFLAHKDEHILKLEYEFPNRVFCFHVKPNEVQKYLLAADYGLLIRESTVTNQVASPVKFAEYLACGLPVIISENLGDYSSFVQHNPTLGFVLNDEKLVYPPLDIENKKRIRNMSLDKFKKNNFISNYKILIK